MGVCQGLGGILLITLLRGLAWRVLAPPRNSLQINDLRKKPRPLGRGCSARGA
jgi:hypothetical protein